MIDTLTLKKTDPVTVFDSGLGGLSVVRELIKLLPHENIIYFGDSLHAPYGIKETDELIELCEANFKMFLEMRAKCVVIACNTATSVAGAYLTEKYPHIPIIGIEPAVKPAAKSGNMPRVLVLATPVTIKGEKLGKLIFSLKDEARFTLLPAPKLVDFVESGITDKCPSEELISYLRELFYNSGIAGCDEDGPEAPCAQRTSVSRRFDAIVLGCTHFPFVKDSIVKALGYKPAIFDGAPGTSRQVRRKLSQAGLLNNSEKPGRITLLNSDETKLPLERQLLEFR